MRYIPSYCPLITKEKSPCIQAERFCVTLKRKAKKLAMPPKIFPYINPSKGIVIWLLNGRRFTTTKNRNVPAAAKPKDSAIFPTTDKPGKKIIPQSIPTLAASTVPTVSGAAKRFCVNDCMISPDKDNPAPARRTVIVLGSLDDNSIRRSVLLPARNCSSENAAVPTQRESTITPVKASTSSNFFNIYSPSSKSNSLMITILIENHSQLMV